MRAINFNAGPAGLPLPALERARDELLDFQGSGHVDHGAQPPRQGVRGACTTRRSRCSRELLGVPDTHQVLFLQGGASPAVRAGADELPARGRERRLRAHRRLGREGARRGEAPRHAARRRDHHRPPTSATPRVPTQAELKLDPKAAYVHITTNNTIYGTQWHAFPDVGAVPLVADMSSTSSGGRSTSRSSRSSTPGAQKNIGPSGVTVVLIARRTSWRRARKDIPKIFRYSTHAENNSLYNTPPTFAIYLMRNVLAWIKEHGRAARRWSSATARRPSCSTARSTG